MTNGIDISSEEYRTYSYANGGEYKITAPCELHIMPNGSHRVIDQAGITHRPSPDYVGLSWKPRDGQPAFVA